MRIYQAPHKHNYIQREVKRASICEKYSKTDSTISEKPTYDDNLK